MTDEELAERNHGTVRNMVAKLSGEYQARGMLPVDVTIGLAYGAFDAATEIHAGDMPAAIEWLRNMLDLMERQMIAGGAEG